jgi:hypothetical protein
MSGNTFFAYNANDNLTLAKDPLGRMESRMKYADGQEVRLGDRVKLGQDDGGAVVASIDTGEYSAEHPESQWSYLKRGAGI